MATAYKGAASADKTDMVLLPGAGFGRDEEHHACGQNGYGGGFCRRGQAAGRKEWIRQGVGMILIGTIVNTVAVLGGSTVGLLLKKGIPEKFSDIMMKGVALCTLYIGISGALKGENTIILILSMVLGAIIGELLDLDGKLNRIGGMIERKFKKEGETVSLAQGFVSASLLFCVGAMTIVGSLQSGLSGDHEMLFTKSVLDCISSIVFASSMGIGVLFSAIFVFGFQGAITLGARALAPVLTDSVVAEMTCAGSVIIIALGLNMLGLTKLKVMNYIPAIFLPILFCLFL